MQRVVALLVVAGFAVAACSGDDDSADSTTTVAEAATSTEPAPPDSTAPPSTTAAAPPTTSAPTTTEAPPDTTAPDTTAPPTTVDPLADLAGSVQRDLSDGYALWQDITADPTAPDAEERLERYYSGQALNFLLGLLDTYRTDNLNLLANPDVPPVIMTLDEPELVPGSDATAMVTVCQIDSGILMLTDDNGATVPLNTDVVRVVARVTVELVDGIWRMSDGGTGDEEIGETSCDGL